jgi:hypothetical protein
MAEELKSTTTKVEPIDLAVELTAAWRALRAETPSRESILTLVAHSAMETGHWSKCICWNIGNVKSVPGDGRDYTFFRTSEVEDGIRKIYDPPHPATRFRAFRTLREGALDHLAFLMGRQRYAAAWQQVLAGDPMAYVMALHHAGYFTAEPAPVARTVFGIYTGYLHTLSFEPAPVDPELDDADKERVMGRVALSLHELAGQALLDERHPSEPPPTPRNA